MSRFDDAYRSGAAPWDTGRPQPELLGLLREGALKGRILDAGCGTGEAVLLLLARGLDARGYDASPLAVERARAKAVERGLDPSRVELRDLLDPGHGAGPFDTVVDLAVLHTFDDAQWPRYVRSLGSLLTPGGAYFGLAFSEREPADWGGPRRVTQEQIRALFAEGWDLEWIREAKYELAFRPEPAKAWMVKATLRGMP